MHRKPLYTTTKFAIVYEPAPERWPCEYEWAPRDGDYIVHQNGSAYFVTGVSASKKIAGRYNCRCLRWSESEIPANARVHHTTPLRPTKKRRLREKPPLVFSPRRQQPPQDCPDDGSEDD